MLLIRGDESAAEHANDGCGGWDTEMLRRGVLVGAGGLRPPDEGKAVRVRRRQLLLADGPFAETKEQVGGFCIIECANFDEAVEIAAAHPAATYGTIEIRQML
ncbi:MAG TPA: YciI family protein [Streptosporangiaceae bacterium]